ncbi:MAG TPA: CARDB domain-containing protein [Solirubrobacteraceae bacterium]|nr:CARDB domain-containing protein [Solirubrobacteraceae bacterium]
MRRALLVGCLACVLAGTAVARADQGTPGATTTPAVSAPPPALAVTLDSCTTGALAADRVAVFSASMPAVAGATQLAMRFRLYARRGPQRPWQRLDVPKWGIWQRSAPGVPGFVYSKRIGGLVAPAEYRALVQFRWRDDDGALVRSRTRVSPTCAEPDLRPDLVLTKVAATPAADGGATYALTVANRGRGPSGPFDLALTIDDADQDDLPVDALPAGASRTVTLVAPPCTDVLRIWVDPANVVPEVHEHRAAIVRSCPLG